MSPLVNESVSQLVNESARELGSSIHEWFCSAIGDSQQPISPIGFLFLKLPPPPRAVLLVSPVLSFFVLVFWQDKKGYAVLRYGSEN